MSPSLQVGKVAPDFALLDEHGALVKLSSFRGKKSFCTSIRRMIRLAALPKHVDSATVLRRSKRRTRW